MIENKEFEEIVKKILRGDTTRKKVSKEYKMSMRKLNDMISQLSKTNPELYNEFISRFPYKPKSITNIDFVELTKEMIKKDLSSEIEAEIYEISARTVTRRINEFKNSDAIDEKTGMTLHDLYNLYKRYKKGELSIDDIKFIGEMKIGQVIKKEKTKDREDQLTDLINRYYILVNKGLSKAKAARKLGFEYTDMYKKEKELERIKTQNSAKSKMGEFKNQYKEIVKPLVNNQRNEEKELKKDEKER